MHVVAPRVPLARHTTMTSWASGQSKRAKLVCHATGSLSVLSVSSCATVQPAQVTFGSLQILHAFSPAVHLTLPPTTTNKSCNLEFAHLKPTHMGALGVHPSPHTPKPTKPTSHSHTSTTGLSLTGNCALGARLPALLCASKPQQAVCKLAATPEHQSTA
jgi:hypothetical protein